MHENFDGQYLIIEEIKRIQQIIARTRCSDGNNPEKIVTYFFCFIYR